MGIGNYSYAGSFQIIVEVDYAIVIVTLCDWLNHLTPVFQNQSHLVRAMFPTL